MQATARPPQGENDKAALVAQPGASGLGAVTQSNMPAESWWDVYDQWRKWFVVELALPVAYQDARCCRIAAMYLIGVGA